ncbi:hypothetical protein J2T57_002980 [Natronocella acetinitrilica]|uniref:Uncharacterized protein n=1 Tax=Natronocella acetinitrilica TaxID=414046 RepID=A0AAE3G4U0_9GAMM|nr:hypothetical protein [Natronocella acetinitrilica]MCP1675825.1 hypothetical protein [Natronocella acetinitrilica]
MEALVTSGRVVDLVLLLTAAEAIALVAYHRLTGRGVPPGELIPYLLAGVFILLALRVALVGAAWYWIPVLLLGSLFAHLGALAKRGLS